MKTRTITEKDLNIDRKKIKYEKIEVLKGEVPREVIWASLKHNGDQEVVDAQRIEIRRNATAAEINKKLKLAQKRAHSRRIYNPNILDVRSKADLLETEYDLWIRKPSLILYSFSSKNRRFVDKVFAWKDGRKKDPYASTASIRVSRDGRDFCWYSNFNMKEETLKDPHEPKKYFNLYTARFALRIRNGKEVLVKTPITIDPGNQNNGQSGFPPGRGGP